MFPLFDTIVTKLKKVNIQNPFYCCCYDSVSSCLYVEYFDIGLCLYLLYWGASSKFRSQASHLANVISNGNIFIQTHWNYIIFGPFDSENLQQFSIKFSVLAE
uniref:(northern house mosquito) hypothetical protein n=1 Tax=Culex pipiens TaxID=7175 RepID=A0A8D8AZX6_CULPI